MSVTAPPAPPKVTVEPIDRRPSRRTRLIRLGIALLALAVAGLVLWLGFFSSVLDARSVQVRGARQISADDVRTAANVPLGRPMLRQDTDAIARQVSTLPAVRSVTVERNWPHTITIKVVERTAVLAVRQPDGYLLADAFGVAFRTSDDVPDGVVVTDANPDDHAVLTELSTVAGALPAKLAKQVISLRPDGAGTMALTLKSGVRVSWGDSSQSKLKGQVVLGLLKQKPRQSIDVTSPHNPAIR